MEHACTDGFCGASGDTEAGLDTRRTTPHEESEGGRIVGVVTDLEGTVLVGITVQAGSVVDLTDADGGYELADVPPGEHVVHFSHTGYLGTHRGITLGEWETVAINERLMPRRPATSIDPSRENKVGDEDGSATFPADGFVDESGEPVTETVEASVTPIDPTTDELDGGPGDYMAETPEGEAPLVSYGMVEIQTVDADGNPVELAEGESIEVVIPAPDIPGRTLEVGDTVPTWIYDENLPGWVEDGEATVEMRDGQLVLVGTVNDTNITWNCDDPEVLVCFNGRVVDCAGYPIPGAEVQLRGSGVTSLTTDRTTADGTYTVSGTARAGAIIRASLRVGSISYFVDSDLITTSGAGCSDVPDLNFEEIRYTTGRVEVGDVETHLWSAGADIAVNGTTGSAFFFDLLDPDAGPFVSCEPPDNDTLRQVDLDDLGGGDIPFVDVGNPILIDSDAGGLDVLRNYGEVDSVLELRGYASQPGSTSSFVSGDRHTVDIPGAPGALPHTVLSNGLAMPSDLVVTTPDLSMERSVTASEGMSLRWESGSSSELRLLVQPLAGTTMLVGSLTDDGSYDVPAEQLTPYAGSTVRVTLTRLTDRYESLATGPALQLRGQSRVTFEVTLR